MSVCPKLPPIPAIKNSQSWKYHQEPRPITHIKCCPYCQSLINIHSTNYMQEQRMPESDYWLVLILPQKHLLCLCIFWTHQWEYCNNLGMMTLMNSRQQECPHLYQVTEGQWEIHGRRSLKTKWLEISRTAASMGFFGGKNNIINNNNTRRNVILGGRKSSLLKTYQSIQRCPIVTILSQY